MKKESFRRWLRLTWWRLRYLWLDTPFGRWMHIGLAAVLLLIALWKFPSLWKRADDGVVHAEITLFVQIMIMVVSSLIMMALTPKTPDAADQVNEAPRVEDGVGVRMVFGEVWITDPAVIGWKKMGTKTIRGKKSGFNGRPIIGYWYKQLFHFVLCRGPVDAVLEFRGGDKTAWKGELTAGGEVQINQRELWGGQGTGGEGGIEGPLEFLFGDADQLPSSYLAGALGTQQPAYRGLLTALFKGGLWGAFSPYPKAASFKVRRILEGWDREGGCWYPERASVPITGAGVVLHGSGWDYQVEVFAEPNTAWSNWAIPGAGWLQGGEMPYSTNGASGGAYWTPMRSNLWVRRRVTARVNGLTMRIAADNGAVVFVDGVLFGASNETNEPVADNSQYPVLLPMVAGQTFDVHVKVFAEKLSSSDAGNILNVSITGDLPVAMNPAHMLYQSITDSWMGAEPEAGVNDASFRTAADTLFAEGMGLCTEWDSTTESVEAFQQRICNVIGANLSRSPVDGLWNLDLVRGGYSTDSLPLLTDDDVIDYTEQPGALQDAVNQVIVEWRDPLMREDRSTAPVQSLGGIQAAGGVMGEVATYREIPEETLALRVAGRDLQAKALPLRRISVKATRIAYAWRPGQVIRLQTAKRGISSMYCRVADVDRGTLRSGAIALTLLQDVFGLPRSVYVNPDPGSDVDDEEVPKPVAALDVQEVPYALLASLQPTGELAALPLGAGYLFAVATPSGSEIDYSMQVDAGQGYLEQAESDWGATAINVSAVSRVETVVAISNARGLDMATVGSMVLWGMEICRLDDVDLIGGTITLGRGCADTVARPHGSDERLWVIDDSIALDATRYDHGDSLSVKLLPRTSSQRLELAGAAAVELAFASRQARPYPPAAVTLNGSQQPGEVFEVAAVAWRHRDRLASGARLIDQDEASIGPETGTTYSVRWYLNGVLDHAETNVTGSEVSYAPASDGLLRIEVEAVRDSLVSWQFQSIECPYRVSHYSDYVDQDGDIYADHDGVTYNG